MSPTTPPLPFRCVTARGDMKTHLVTLSPALRGTYPDQTPPATLCGLGTLAESALHPAQVECGRCLSRIPQFMGLPTYEVVP